MVFALAAIDWTVFFLASREGERAVERAGERAVERAVAYVGERDVRMR